MFIDAVGWVSSTIFGKSNTSVGFKALPNSLIIPEVEDVSGIALNCVKGVEVMRNLNS